MAKPMIPLLLDTDIGSDIDDAAALAYLLRQPRCELLGVTTVTGDTQARAKLADVLCVQAGRPNLPIYAGRGPVLLEGIGQPSVPQAEVLKRWPHRKALPSEALEFLGQTIRSRPGEITLLTIGPLTNIAALFLYDPEIPKLLKRLVLMAGNFRSAMAEWNIRVDPVAGAIVFKAPVPEILSVGLDVTFQCVRPAKEIKKKFTTPLLRAVVDMMRDRPQIVFHDPLAAAMIFEPGICGWARGWIEADFHDTQDRGATRFLDDPKGRHLIAETVDSARFFRHYYGVVTLKS